LADDEGPFVRGHPVSAGRITIAALETAINRARAAQPASGPESALTLEVATLGALYGRLIWEQRDGIDTDALTDAERVALRLWLPSAG
jgi:hypothetical protein